MLSDVTLGFTIAAIAGSGLVAGVFFAFSTFVMRGLAQMPVASGILAMQRINVTVINPWFMLAFLGTPAICVYLLIVAAINLDNDGAVYLFTGSLVHIVGSLLVTAAFNVPRNNALATVDPDSDAGKAAWLSYVREWTLWNHIRTVASLASVVLLSLAVLWA